MKAIKAMFAVSLTVLSLGSTSVFADGFLGGAIETLCGNCGAGRELDRVHKEIGQPLDYVAANTITAYTGVPMGNVCVTPGGWANAAIQPKGIPCSITRGQWIYYGFIQ